MAEQTETQDTKQQPRGPRVRPWAALAFPQFRLLWGALLIGGLGRQMKEAANLWMVWELSGSALQLGLLGAFRVVPLIFFSLFGGMAADLMNRKNVLLITQIGNLILACALAVLAFSQRLEIWHLYAVTLVSSCLNSFEQPARLALIPSLVPKSSLTNAITLNTASQHSSSIFGPTFGALLIAWWGAGAAYSLAAVGLIAVIVALFFLRSPPSGVPSSSRPRFNLVNMLEGLRFLWTTPIMQGLVLLDTMAMVFTSYRTLMPIFADRILGVGPVGYGTLLSAPSVGFLVGSGLLLLAGDVRRKVSLVLICTALYACAVALFALSPFYLLSLLLMAAVGGLDAVGTIVRHTVLQLRVPDGIRGRATAGLQVFVGGSPSLGQIVTGSIAGVLGAPGSLLFGSWVCVGAVVTMLIRLRRTLDL